MRQQVSLYFRGYTLNATLVYSDTCEESGLRVEDLDLRPVDSEGGTISRNGWVDGDQGVRARRNREDPVTGEVSHSIARVLDAKIGVCEGERCARGKFVVLRTVKPLSAGKAHQSSLVAWKDPKGTGTNIGKVQDVAGAIALCSSEDGGRDKAHDLEQN